MNDINQPDQPRSRKRLLAGLCVSVIVVLLAIMAWLMVYKPQSPSQTTNKPTVETYRIEGVSVAKYSPATKTDKPPVIMVHGGEHGKWAWQNWATFFSEAGYEVHALDWYNHGDSDKLPEDQFIKRSIVDVARREIKAVAGQLKQKPILIGHSMGGLASAVYAEGAPVDKLVLLTPVMPAAVKPDPVPLPIDMTKPVGVFPYGQTKQLFFTTLDDVTAHQAYDKLVPYLQPNWIP